MFCLPLLFLFPILILANFPPFENEQLPRERVINIWKPTFGQKVWYPFHFGPTGTQAYESFLISFTFQPSISIGITDCFCGGDEFIFSVFTATSPTSPVIVIPASPLDPELLCNAYSEDFVNVCSQQDFWSHNFVNLDVSLGPFVNVTISTLNSPYGGGVGYFWYQSVTP